MFRFEHPDLLYALLLLPVLVGVFLLYTYQRRRALARLVDTKLLPRLAPGVGAKPHLRKFILMSLALLFLIIAWANPQWSTNRQEVERQGVDLIIALDISRSMLAEDVQPSRLERAKRFAQQLVEELAGNNIGIELFACTPFMQVPLTTDYAFAMQSIRAASTDQATAQGTAIGDAIDLAERSFEAASQNHRALILLSDGEEHDEQAVAAAESAADRGLSIFAIGVGTEGGGFIPVLSTRRRPEFVQNEYGEPVRTRLEAQLLQDVAAAGGGVYYDLNQGEDALSEQLQRQLSRIEQRAFESQSFIDFESYFQYFIAVALLLLAIEFALSYRSGWGREDVDLV